MAKDRILHLDELLHILTRVRNGTLRISDAADMIPYDAKDIVLCSGCGKKFKESETKIIHLFIGHKRMCSNCIKTM